MNENRHNSELPNPQLELDTQAALGAVAGREAQSVERITVSFRGYRVRPLDPDNFAGSCKDLLDGLRYAGLIPDDTAAKITLQTEQEKVKTYKEERTQITIIYP